MRTDKQYYRLGVRTYPAGDKSKNFGGVNQVGYGSLPIYTELDFDYVYHNLFGGDLSFGVRNIAGSKRPLDDTVGIRADSLNTSLYDPVGRAFYLGYSYNF